MWHNFEVFAIISLASWCIAILASVLNKGAKVVNYATVLGIVCLAMFIALLWLNVQRPPLRTLGETRLWYSFFLAVLGYVLNKRWQIRLMLVYSLSMAMLFLLLNYLSPEIHSKTLMPALQSIWFVPHVIVYMIAYALLGLSALFGFIGLYAIKKGNLKEELILKTDNIVYIGFGFLTLGLLFGAIWAKEAWGHYWTWDPKETWAFLTWGVYLIYIHFRLKSRINHKQELTFLLLAFVLLLICWFGINYLPTAQNSVHIYSN